MAPRMKPTNRNRKKDIQKLKRAIKRGEVEPPEETIHFRSRPLVPFSGASAATASVIEATRRLQSAFVKLPPHFLEETKVLAAILPLTRPIPANAATFTDGSDDTDVARLAQLACPRRPKWRFDMTKEEVESNEAGAFSQWLTQTEALIEQWQTGPSGADPVPEDKDAIPQPPTRMPRSTSYFERNIEVWRQLWRVTEISQIVLVLLDARCPLLHYPPSLAAFLADAGRRIILVLTKVDIAGPARADAWCTYLRGRFGVRVVQVESFSAKEGRGDHQGRKTYEPHLPDSFRQRLVEAVQEVHAELLQPPEEVKGDPDKLNNWKPTVKREINWDAVKSASGGSVGSILTVPQHRDDGEASDGHDQKSELLTIGVIGQPNVGKSSLLNALFGTCKVHASKTPGKTKHFQTLFWTSDVRLVDCPGLVMPNYVPMEMQVFAGIFPISRVAAVPACIYHAAQLLPLERILHLEHPAAAEPVLEDKRTWRGGVRPAAAAAPKPVVWTALDVLTAYADAKGWVTARAGRPDVNRAGNYMLRLVAEGRAAWAFWPPGADVAALGDTDGNGTWIPTKGVVDDNSESTSESEGEGEETRSYSEPASEEEEEEEEDDGESDGVGAATAGSRFGALALDAAEETEDESDSKSNHW